MFEKNRKKKSRLLAAERMCSLSNNLNCLLDFDVLEAWKKVPEPLSIHVHHSWCLWVMMMPSDDEKHVFENSMFSQVVFLVFLFF